MYVPPHVYNRQDVLEENASPTRHEEAGYLREQRARRWFYDRRRPLFYARFRNNY